MATQEYIDDLIIVIETAEDAESVTNQMVAAVLGFLNEHLKLVSQSEKYGKVARNSNLLFFV